MSIFDFFSLVKLDNFQKINYIKNKKTIKSNMNIIKIKIKNLRYKKINSIVNFALSTIILINIFFIIYSFLFYLIIFLYYNTYKTLRWELNFIKNYDLKFCNLN